MKSTVLGLMGGLCLLPAMAQETPHAVRAGSTGTTYLGVMVQEINGDRAKALKLSTEAGVEVTRVEPDSPAEKAGLKLSDVIMQYNGQRVEGMEQFSRLVRETPAGREVKLDIVRSGAPQNVVVKVAARRAPQPFAVAPAIPPVPMERFELRMPDMPRSFMSWRSSALGIECETLEGQLATYFAVKEGVLVRSVSKGSAAEKAGIKAGDVIIRVDDAHVVTPADISSRIRSMRGKSVSVVLMRDHKEMSLSVMVDEEDRVDNWWYQNSAPVAPNPRVQQ
jgi:serine protease Do